MNNNIVIYHVGGEGGMGPIDKLLGLSNVSLVLFEIRKDTSDREVVDKLTENGIPVKLVNACIYSEKKNLPFHVNKHRLSSGLFLPSGKMINEHIACEGIKTWGENTQLDYTFDVEADTLDNIVEELNLPRPDVLSLDMQGAEYHALKGAEKILANELLCVQNEIEFCEIYEGQPLFQHQHQLLSDNGFRLIDIFSQQFWHPSPVAGEGFLTVGENIYFRFFDLNRLCSNWNESKSLSKLLKLAEIAFCFQRFSFSNMIIEKIIKNYPDQIGDIERNVRYKSIFKKYHFVTNNAEKHYKDNLFFKNIERRLAMVKNALRFITPKRFRPFAKKCLMTIKKSL